MKASVRRAFGVATAGLLAGLVACAESGGDDTEFEPVGAFEEVGRVTLEEDPADPIAAISSLTRRPGGGYLVVDGLSDQVHVFDANGRLQQLLGRSGDGPGELDAPTAAVELADGRVLVAQRANPRMTVFPPDGPPSSRTLPGLYGQWLADLDGRLAVRIGSRGDRFVVTTYEGDSLASFGVIADAVNETPFWIYYARENAARFGQRIAINTSFFPTIRVFSMEGELVDSLGSAPDSWVQAGAPPVDQARTPATQEAVKEWSRQFTVVSALAGLESGQLVVQYGRHSPTDQDTYAIEPTTIDVYSADGTKVASEVEVSGPVLAGGPDLVVLVAEPPEPWTLARYVWRASRTRE